MTQYDISIVSDTVCPWCYVGKKRLESAITQHKVNHPDDTFRTHWHPFYLNPHAPRESIDKQTYYERRFGPERTTMMQTHLSRVGSQAGINFAFGGKLGNTRDSHRLVALGATKGEAMETRVVEELFEAYFEANEDITDWKVLVERGVRAGLDEGEVRGWLESDGGGDVVDREAAEAAEGFVAGVPDFTINGKFKVHGAEEPKVFLDIFDRVKSDTGKNTVTSGGRANLC